VTTLGDYIPLSGAAQLLGALVIAVLVGCASVLVDRTLRPAPAPDVRTDTVRVEGTEPDTTGEAATPTTVTLYDTIRVTETRTDTVRVPTGFDVEGCFQGPPIRRETSWAGPDDLTLTYWKPDDQRYEQRTYEAGRPAWALWPEVEIRTSPWGWEATPAAAVRWRDWTLTAGYTFADRRGWTLGLRWRPVTFSF
jgi:hypothetical protein